MIGGLVSVWVCCLVWRLLSLQVGSGVEWEEWASKQHNGEIKVASERGPIVDRNGKFMAVSVPAGSIYVRPKDYVQTKLS